MSKYIQSFYQYPVTFSSIGKTIPARSAQGENKNIAEVSDKELETLQNSEPRFRELVRLKHYRVLNTIPKSYVPAAQRITDAESEAAQLKAENEALKARLEALTQGAETEAESTEDAGGEEDLEGKEYKELQAIAKELGIENVNVKKALLIEAIEAAKAEA